MRIEINLNETQMHELEQINRIHKLPTISALAEFVIGDQLEHCYPIAKQILESKTIP